MPPRLHRSLKENYRQRRHTTRGVSLWTAANVAPPLQVYAVRTTANAVTPLGVLVSEMPPPPPLQVSCNENYRQRRRATRGVSLWNAANAVPPLQVSAIWELPPTLPRHLGCKCLNCRQSRPAFTGLCNENYRKRRHAATRGVSFWNAVYAATPLQVYLITNMLSSESHPPTHFSWCSYMRDGPKSPSRFSGSLYHVRFVIAESNADQ